MLLSRNYPPSAALAPYVRRHYVFDARLPDDFTLIDRLLSETAFIRILLEGDWLAEIVPGDWRGAGPIVLFGPNAKPLPVRVAGPFLVIGVAVRPSGWRSIFGCPANECADRMVPLAERWGDAADALLDAVRGAADDAAIVAAIEQALIAQIALHGEHRADPQMRRFEDIARHDSTIRVADAAAKLGLSPRQMERQCLAGFGHSPKAVLRRSRFLDMATAMRGFGSPSEDELAALRYFDQSHLNREFRAFIDMTPGAFAQAETPLLTAGLKLRADGLS